MSTHQTNTVTGAGAAATPATDNAAAIFPGFPRFPPELRAMVWESVPYGPRYLIALSRWGNNGPVTEQVVHRTGNQLATIQVREDLHVPDAVWEARQAALRRLSGPCNILADASQGQVIPGDQDDRGDWVDWGRDMLFMALARYTVANGPVLVDSDMTPLWNLGQISWAPRIENLACLIYAEWSGGNHGRLLFDDGEGPENSDRFLRRLFTDLPRLRRFWLTVHMGPTPPGFDIGERLPWGFMPLHARQFSWPMYTQIYAEELLPLQERVRRAARLVGRLDIEITLVLDPEMDIDHWDNTNAYRRVLGLPWG